MGPKAARQNRQLRAVIGSMPLGRQRAAVRAVFWGPVPDDEEVRRAAHRVVLRDIVEVRRRRGFSRFALAGFMVIGVVLALAVTAWLWFAVLALAVVLAVELWLPGHLQRRADLLGAEPGTPAA